MCIGKNKGKYCAQNKDGKYNFSVLPEITNTQAGEGHHSKGTAYVLGTDYFFVSQAGMKGLVSG
jgi:hypothetical protein